MFKNLTTTYKLLFVAALLSFFYSEILFFQGQKEDARFIGIWVPSILVFGIYLKSYFTGLINFIFGKGFYFGLQEKNKTS